MKRAKNDTISAALAEIEASLPATPLERMRALRPVLKWLRQQVQALPCEQPTYLVAAEFAALQKAAESVRVAKQAVATARASADAALRVCEDLAAEDVGDDDLRAANEKLLRAECDLRMAQQRYRVAIQRQDGCYENAFQAGERAREDDRVAATTFGNELERPNQFARPAADDRPLGHLAHDLADECESYASFCRRRAIDAEIWRENLKRRLRDALEPPIPEPQTTTPREVIAAIQPVIEIIGSDPPVGFRGELPAVDAGKYTQAVAM